MSVSRRERSPAVAAAFEKRLSEAALRATAIVQPLVIRPDTALARLHEPGPTPLQTVDFFLRVGRDAEAYARGWGLTVLPALATDRGDWAGMAERIVAKVRV